MKTELIPRFDSLYSKRVFWLVVLMRGIMLSMYDDRNTPVQRERQIMQ